MLTVDRPQAGKMTGLDSQILRRADGHRLDSTQGHTVSGVLFSLSVNTGIRGLDWFHQARAKSPKLMPQ